MKSRLDFNDGLQMDPQVVFSKGAAVLSVVELKSLRAYLIRDSALVLLLL